MEDLIYQEALQRAQQEIDRERLALGPDFWPDPDTYWTLVSERAHKMCEPVTTDEFAAMLGVSRRRAQMIIESDAVEHSRIGTQVVVPRYLAEDYAALERKPGRPKNTPRC